MGNFTFWLMFLVCLLIHGSYGNPLSDLEDECEIMDLAILADISRSMKPHDLDQLKNIVCFLADKLKISEDGNRFGFITFGDDATVSNDFADTEYEHATKFKESVAAALNVRPDEEATRTDLGMELALTKLFTKEGGDRPKVRNTMLILTDGKPFKTEIPFENLNERLKNKKVKVLVIGIGPEAKVHQKEMRATVGSRGDVSFFDDFKGLSGEQIYESFKAFFCVPRKECPTDVAFIVDSSGSIHGTKFNDAKKIVNEVVGTFKLASGKNRAALVQFSSSPSLEARFGQYETVDEFQDVVWKLPKMGGRTRIDKALNLAVNQVFPDSREGVYKIAIILTDGVQSGGARGMKQTSKPLRDAGIHVLAVGIGGIKERRLRLMTDRKEDVVNAKKIQDRLEGILNVLSQNDCKLPQDLGLSQALACEDEVSCQDLDYCWSHPDFSAVYCAKSCKLCV